nr:MAG TPA: hypothetical protein [Caudoviricetes sp.]
MIFNIISPSPYSIGQRLNLHIGRWHVIIFDYYTKIVYNRIRKKNGS